MSSCSDKLPSFWNAPKEAKLPMIPKLKKARKVHKVSKVPSAEGKGHSQFQLAALKDRFFKILADDERLGQKHTRRDLAQMFKVDEKTIYNWSKEIEVNGAGSLLRQDRRGRKDPLAPDNEQWGDVVGILQRLQYHEKIWLSRLKKKSKKAYAYARIALQRCDDLALVATRLGEKANLFSDAVLAEVAEARVRLLAVPSHMKYSEVRESPFPENRPEYFSILQIANFMFQGDRNESTEKNRIEDAQRAFGTEYRDEGIELIRLYQSTVGIPFLDWSNAPRDMLNNLRLARVSGVPDRAIADWLLGAYTSACMKAQVTSEVPLHIGSQSRAGMSLIEYRELIRARSFQTLLNLIAESVELDPWESWMRCRAIGLIGPDDESGFSADKRSGELPINLNNY